MKWRQSRYFRLTLLYAILLAATAGYITTNHFQFFQPFELPLTFIDRAIPFLPWTAFIYLLIFPLIIVLPWFLNNDQMYRRAFMACAVLSIINLAAFIVFPTKYGSRPDAFKLFGDSFWGNGYSLLHQLDSTTNCLPSFHVSTCVIMLLIFWRERPKIFTALLPTCVIIIFTTLSTKQHYFVDVLGGLIFGLTAYLIAFKKFPLKK